MQLFLKDEDGRMHEAILLAASRNRMRLAVPNFPDAVEISYCYGHWKTDEGRIVEIEALIADGRIGSEFYYSLRGVNTAE